MAIPVEKIMDTPDGRDEVGTPDELLEHCEAHDVIHRVDGQCLQCKRERKSRRSEAQHRETQREIRIGREAEATTCPDPLHDTDDDGEVSE